MSGGEVLPLLMDRRLVDEGLHNPAYTAYTAYTAYPGISSSWFEQLARAVGASGGSTTLCRRPQLPLLVILKDALNIPNSYNSSSVIDYRKESNKNISVLAKGTYIKIFLSHFLTCRECYKNIKGTYIKIFLGRIPHPRARRNVHINISSSLGHPKAEFLPDPDTKRPSWPNGRYKRNVIKY